MCSDNRYIVQRLTFVTGRLIASRWQFFHFLPFFLLFFCLLNSPLRRALLQHSGAIHLTQLVDKRFCFIAWWTFWNIITAITMSVLVWKTLEMGARVESNLDEWSISCKLLFYIRADIDGGSGVWYCWLLCFRQERPKTLVFSSILLPLTNRAFSKKMKRNHSDFAQLHL